MGNQNTNSTLATLSLPQLTLQQRVEFRDQFRAARALAQDNAEDFHDLLFTLEKLGYYLRQGKGTGLGDYSSALAKFASQTSLPRPASSNACHVPVETLLLLVREARNDALHQGAFARHLTTHATELAIILEDALMSTATTVGDYMVRGPVTADLWQPLSFIRQVMLSHSFSYLPVQDVSGVWKLVSDRKLAEFLRPAPANATSPTNTGAAPPSDRKLRLAQSLASAIGQGLTLDTAATVPTNEEINKLFAKMNGLPVLVVETSTNGAADRLVGIVTPFDLL